MRSLLLLLSLLLPLVLAFANITPPPLSASTPYITPSPSPLTHITSPTNHLPISKQVWQSFNETTQRILLTAKRLLQYRTPTVHFSEPSSTTRLHAFSLRRTPPPYHTPIVIQSDDDFTPENGVVSGSGTADDPYVIGPWLIDASEASSDNPAGIWIQGTTKYFVINGCVIVCSNPSVSRFGIVFFSLSNGAIYNTTVEGVTQVAVYTLGTTNIAIDYLTIHNCASGLLLQSYSALACSNIAISNTTISNITARGSDVFAVGIGLLGVSACDISNVTIANCAAASGGFFTGIGVFNGISIFVNRASCYQILAADNNSFAVGLNIIGGNAESYGIFVNNLLVYNSSYGVLVFSNDANLHNIAFYNATLLGTTPSNGTVGLIIGSSANLTSTYIRDLTIRNARAHGFQVGVLCFVEGSGAYLKSTVFENATFSENGSIGGLLIAPPASGPEVCCDVSFCSCQFLNNTLNPVNGCAGVAVWGTDHVTFYNCSFTNHTGAGYSPYYGLFAFSAHNLALYNTTFVNNRDTAVGLILSYQPTVVNCTLHESLFGLPLEYSTRAYLANNTLDATYNLGIFGSELAHFLHAIEPTNVDPQTGKRTYYLVNVSGVVFDAADAGFVGLVNSDFCKIEGIQPERHIQGVVVAFSRYSSVHNIAVIRCFFGAYLVGSGNSLVDRCGFTGLPSAISLVGCLQTSVSYCNTTLCLISLEAFFSQNLTIRSNTFTYGGTGVLLAATNYSYVEANSVRGFNQTGIHLISAFNDTVCGNLVTSLLASVGINLTVIGNQTVETDCIIYNNWISASTHVAVVNATASWNITAYTQGPNIAGGPYLGGNYWAGFAEVDNNPDDGYNDTAFVIDANNIDYLPLVLEGPLVEIVDPANGTVLAQRSVLVTWYGPGFTPPTDYFNVFLNGTQQNTLPIPAGTDPVYSYTITVPSDGCFEIRVDGFQGIPTPTSSDSVIIYVDTQPPSITITSPSNGSVVAGPQVDIWWTGSDTGTGITHYLVRVDNGDWVDVGLNQSCVVPGLSDGWHSVDVAAVDAAGNAAIDTVVFFADSSPPTIHLLDPPEGGCVSTNASQYTLSWTASDNYNVSAVEVYVNASLKARLSGSTTSYTIDLPEEGIYNISVVAFDSVGFNASSSATIVVDRTSPIVQIVEPSKGCILGSKNLTVAWEVKELEVSSQYIELTYPNGTTHAWKLDATTRNFTIANLDEGSYNVSLHVYDAAGNKGSGTTYFSIDLTPPTLQILNPMNHTLLNTPQITVCINATDAHPCTIEVLLNGQLTKAVNWNSSGLQEIPLDVSEQNYTLTVRATDAANWSASATVVFAVDLTPPSISILQPSESAVLTSTIVTIEWHLSDAYGVAELQLLIDGIEAKRILAPPDSSSVEVLVPEGWHTLQAVAFDYVNHSSQAVRTFAVDTSPPSLQILEPANHSSVPEGNLTVQWRVTDAVGVQKISLYLNDTLIADFDSTATNYVLTLSSGTYIIRLAAIDFAGHETSVVVVVRVTVAPAPAPTPAPSPSALPLLLGIVAAAIVAAVVLLLWRRRKRTR